MANRLQHETSPYLLQHAHNPVDWYPWGDEAFARARAEDKPVLLSVGYSACHWCHVMERESFENAEIAALMNDLFVSIKVDREERPDVDSIYMSAVQALSGHGGWPMTVFLMPDGMPFYGGTYYPPRDSRGMPGFPRVLQSVADAYRNRRGEVEDAAAQIHRHLAEHQQIGGDQEILEQGILDAAYRSLAPSFDRSDGGFGSAPKFPQPMILEFLLRTFHRTGERAPLEMAELTLHKMAQGGMYDQLGGGFHRYSTDSEWLVPHFEKMLYDNAQLAQAYLHAWQLTGNAFYLRIVEETLDYVVREMTSPEGGFYASQDADSEGEEGKFFVWSKEEVEAALGPAEAAIFCRSFGVTSLGNFEGRNILHQAMTPPEVASGARLPVETVENAIDRGRQALFALREERVTPGRDEKVVTAWNGMMLSAFAEAGAVLQRTDYIEVAERNADFLLGTLMVDGRLLRTYKDGRAHIAGYLEDHAQLAAGLLDLWQSTADPRWLKASKEIADLMRSRFWDETLPGFYDTANDQVGLIVRPRDVLDNATPSGSSVAVDVLLRLAILTGSIDFEHHATATLRSMAGMMTRAPSAFGRLLSALDFAIGEPREIVIVGERAERATLETEVWKRYLPNKVVAAARPNDVEALGKWIPLLEGKTTVGGRTAAYVCRNYFCQAPVSDAASLAAILDH